MSVSVQAVVTRHWDDRVRSYVRNHDWLFRNRAAQEKWKLLVAGFIGPVSGLDVLDAGCGPGTLTGALVRLAHRVTAVDVSREMLEQAGRILGDQADKVRFLNADASSIPLPGQSFDWVVSRYVVWTLPDPAQAVREWMRLLRPGGRLCIIDGNWYYHYYRGGWARWWLHVMDLGYKIKNGFDKSQKMATSYVAGLPATHVIRPDWDIGLLSGVGFVDIQVKRRLDVLVSGMSWQRLNTHLARPFMVQARKPGPEAGVKKDARA
jgi:ubiquinone/menaquinone biosynthesis C-methylase UbiE